MPSLVQRREDFVNRRTRFKFQLLLTNSGEFKSNPKGRAPKGFLRIKGRVTFIRLDDFQMGEIHIPQNALTRGGVEQLMINRHLVRGTPPIRRNFLFRREFFIHKTLFLEQPQSKFLARHVRGNKTPSSGTFVGPSPRERFARMPSNAPRCVEG